jgi:SWI/SNF-related matrix-associated actin-dependent regulator of chromatin subfamily A member 5
VPHSQVCSFFAYLVAEQPIGLGEKGPFLVVCPLSVLETWLSEIRRWCPGLRAVRYHGNERERKRLMEREAAAGQFDVLCTSYETLVADPGMFQTGRFWWRYVHHDLFPTTTSAIGVRSQHEWV